MVKIIFRKIGVFIAMLFWGFLAVFMSAFLLEQIQFIVNLSHNGTLIAMGIIAVVMEIWFAYKIKIENKAVKINYNNKKSDLVSLLSKIGFILKSKNYIGNVIALNIGMLPFWITAGISEHTPFYQFVKTTIVLSLEQTIIFTIVDTIFSLIIFEIWNRRG